MPHVISEAGAAGLPVVATRDNGTKEQIADGKTGLFVPHCNPGAVAAGIQRLIADPPLRRQLGDNLRRKVTQEYGVTALIPQWERLFDDVLASREGRRVAADIPPPQ
jgi:glycosyltransferase involved in cell wall biosynthesis